MTRYTNDGGVKTKEEMYAAIKDNVLGDYAKYGFGRFAVVLKEENAFIGFSGLKYLPEEDAVDLGYRFRTDLWGKGIGTESAKASMEFGFGTLGLKSMIASALPANLASINILKKMGFDFEKEYFYDSVLIYRYVLASFQ